MAGVHSIEPVKQIIRLGIGLCDPKYVFLPTRDIEDDRGR